MTIQLADIKWDTRQILIRGKGERTPHTLRHTFAAHLRTKGMPLDCLQDLLGHDDIKNTRIYAKLVAQASKNRYDKYC